MIGNMKEILMISYRRGEHLWWFFYRDTEEDKAAVLQIVGKFAVDPDDAFTGHDASIVAKQVRGRSVSPEELIQ